MEAQFILTDLDHSESVGQLIRTKIPEITTLSFLVSQVSLLNRSLERLMPQKGRAFTHTQF